MHRIIFMGFIGAASVALPNFQTAIGAEPASPERQPSGIVTGLVGQPVIALATELKNSQPNRGLNLGDPVPAGRMIRTGQDSRVEIVWEHRALVTVQESSRVGIDESQRGRTEIQLKAGTVRVALAYRAGRPTDFVTIYTPSSRVVTRGGIVEVGVTASPRLTAFNRVTNTFVRRTSPRPSAPEAAETVQILEGQARIEPLGSDARSQLIDARSQVQILGGTVAGIMELPVGMEQAPALEAAAVNRAIPPPIKERMIALHVQHALDVEKSLQSPAAVAEKPDVTQQDLRGTVLSTSLGVPGTVAPQETAGSTQTNVAPPPAPVPNPVPPPIAPIPTPAPPPVVETRTTRTPSPAPIPDLARRTPTPDVRTTAPDQSGGLNSNRLMRDIMRGDEGDRGRGDRGRGRRGGRDD